jgi:osmoprotectant transport system permease protein
MVELPLAFSVIMAGIRTAAVICVGLATLAAFVGGGGLGDFIMTGLGMANNNLTLLGAIPAALMALLLDFMLSKVENWLTPKGLKI